MNDPRREGVEERERKENRTNSMRNQSQVNRRQNFRHHPSLVEILDEIGYGSRLGSFLGRRGSGENGAEEGVGLERDDGRRGGSVDRDDVRLGENLSGCLRGSGGSDVGDRSRSSGGGGDVGGEDEGKEGGRGGRDRVVSERG